MGLMYFGYKIEVFVFFVMSVREIVEVLHKMGRENNDEKNFPIPDIIDIIASYVYEYPTKCVQIIENIDASSLIALENGGFTNCVKVWNSDGECVQVLPKYEDPYALIKLKDGSLVCTINDNTIFWEKRNKVYCIRQIIPEYLLSAIELRNGKIVSGFEFGKFKIWEKNVKTNQFNCIQIITDCGNVAWPLIELRNGSVVCGIANGTIRIYNSDFKINQVFLAHDDLPTTAVELSNDTFATGAHDSAIKIWKLNNNIYSCIQTINDHYFVIADIVKLKNDSFASASWDSTIKIWKFDGSSYICERTLFSENSHSIDSLIELKDGRLVCSGSTDKKIFIWG